MAQNVVEILVKSKNDTKAGFSAAKADAELAGEEAGQSFASRFAARLGNMWNGNGGGSGGLLGMLGGQFGNVGALSIGAAIAPAIAAAVVELDGLVSGFAAAAAGAGSFGLLALPTLDRIKTAYTNISTAQTAYNKALEKEKLDPTAANKKAAATALLNLKVAQEQAGPSTTKAIDNIHKLMTEFSNLAKPFQPIVLQMLNQALTIAEIFLPKIVPLAQAFATALGPLLKQFGDFVASPEFQTWLEKFTKLIGPATTAIGQGFGKVMTAFGQLLTVMSSHDVQHAINILFDFLAGFFSTLAKWITGAMKNWDAMSRDIEHWYQDTRKWLIRAMGDLANWAQDVDNIVGKVIGFWRGLEHFFQRVPGDIKHALGSLDDMLFRTGSDAMLSLLHGAESMFQSVLHTAEGWAHDIANAIGAPFGIHWSEPSEATKMVKAGQNIARGLATGITSGRSQVGLALAGLAASAGGYGGSGQLVITGAGAPQFMALVKAIWPSLQFEVRTRGGGGPGSVQRALGQ